MDPDRAQQIDESRSKEASLAKKQAADKRIAREKERAAKKRERIRAEARKEAEERALKKVYRSEEQERIEQSIARTIVRSEATRTIDDSIETPEIDGNKLEIDPREYVIPSASSLPDGSREHRTKYDDARFALHKLNRFAPDRITDYIAIMFEYFDVEPYREDVETTQTRSGMKTNNIQVPNDLPLFSEFGFRAGLTNKDIEQLRLQSERFDHAYEMCSQKQEQILITNMLRGLYPVQAATFSAKNLLGWRNNADVEVSAEVDLNRIVESVSLITEKQSFVDAEVMEA